MAFWDSAFVATEKEPKTPENRLFQHTLRIALNPHDDEENEFVWNVLDQVVCGFWWVPGETDRHPPLRKILQHVVDKSYGEDCDETVALAGVAIAALPEAEMLPTPPHDAEKPTAIIVNTEEMIIALIEGQIDLL